MVSERSLQRRFSFFAAKHIPRSGTHFMVYCFTFLLTQVTCPKILCAFGHFFFLLFSNCYARIFGLIVFYWYGYLRKEMIKIENDTSCT